MKYAKIINEHLISFAPTHGMWKNVIYGDFYRHPDVLLEMGYLPVEEVEKPTITNTDTLVTTYSVVDGRIVPHYEIETLPPPNRELSKVRLYRALAQRGLWNTFATMIESNPAIKMEWELSTTLEEQNEFVQGAIAEMKNTLSLSDSDIEQLIQESEVM